MVARLLEVALSLQPTPLGPVGLSMAAAGQMEVLTGLRDAAHFGLETTRIEKDFHLGSWPRLPRLRLFSQETSLFGPIARISLIGSALGVPSSCQSHEFLT